MQNNLILKLLEQIYKSATIGKNYTKSNYEFDRYSEIEKLTTELFKHIDGFKEIQINTFEEKKYITPKVGVNAIIVNENNEYLLEQRMDDKCWGIIGGWCEVGFSPEENIKREVFEETGLIVEIEKQIGIISRTPNQHQLHTSYHILYKCKVVSGKLKKSYESENLAWQKLADIENWHYDHKSWFEFYFENL